MSQYSCSEGFANVHLCTRAVGGAGLVLTKTTRPPRGRQAEASGGIPDANLLERLFGEERRRTKVIPHAFGERAVLKLMYAALIPAPSAGAALE
jgi:hypothetical protein